MDLKEIHDWLDFVIDKEKGGWFPPEEKDNALDRAQMFYFNIRRRNYAISQEDQDALAPFKTSFQMTESNTPDGLITLPQDYQSLLSLYRQTVDESGSVIRKGIDIVNDDELTDRLGNRLRPVDINDPVGQWYGRGQIQLWPNQPNAGVVNYLRRPSKPFFSYALVDDAIIYDEDASEQMEWDDPNTELIMIKALEYLGVNLDNEKLLQYTRS